MDKIWLFPLPPVALVPTAILGISIVGTASPIIAAPRPIPVAIPELPPLNSFWVYQPVENSSISASSSPLQEATHSSTVSSSTGSTVRLVLRLSERVVYVYQGETAIASYPVAIGRPDTPTPTGEFQIFEMIEDPAWQNPRTGEVEAAGADGSLGTRWMGFVTLPHGVIGFHGTPNRDSIGRAASHGCVRMRNEDAVALFQQITLGTLVSVEP